MGSIVLESAREGKCINSKDLSVEISCVPYLNYIVTACHFPTSNGSIRVASLQKGMNGEPDVVRVLDRE